MSRCWSCVGEVLLLLGQRGAMLSWLLLLETPSTLTNLLLLRFSILQLREQWCWAVCPQSPYCDGSTKSRLQIRGQIPCKYPAPNTEHKCHCWVFLIWQFAHWQQIWTKFRFSVWENFLWRVFFYLKKWGQGLSRCLIIQRWRHFPRPAEFITSHKIGSQDVYERYKVESKSQQFDFSTVEQYFQSLIIHWF